MNNLIVQKNRSNEKVNANLKEKTQKVIKKSDEGLKWRIKINKEGANQD